MVKTAKRGALIVAILAAALYAGDFLSLWLRIPNRPQTQQIQVRPYYAVPQKDRRNEELIFLEPKPEVCVNSLLPEMGHRPCWYLRKHVQQRIDL